MGDDDEDHDEVEEEVFEYLELRDLCDAHLHETFFEHYHVVVLDTDDNTTGDTDADIYGEGQGNDESIGIDTKYYEECQQEKETIYDHTKSSFIMTTTWNNRLWTANSREN